MKATGMIRSLDGLGRIVIPMDLRRSMGIGRDAQFEILLDTVDGEQVIVLRLYHPRAGCVFCGNVSDTREFAGKHVCASCVRQLAG